MPKRFPPDYHEFLKEIIPGHSYIEINEMVREKFGFKRTGNTWLHSYKRRHGIKSFLERGGQRDVSTKLFPKEIQNYILQNYKGVGPKEMAEKILHLFGKEYKRCQIEMFYRRKKLDSGLTGQFEKGHSAWNKSQHISQPESVKKTYFRKGHVPYNSLPVGSRVKKDDEYWWVKIAEPHSWRQEHILIWEAANGPLPKGKMVIFLDGNRDNLRLDNLAIIDKAVHANMVLRKRKLRFNDPELTKTGILIATLRTKNLNIEKGAKNGK